MVTKSEPAVLRCHPGDCGQVTQVTFWDQLFNAYEVKELSRFVWKLTSRVLLRALAAGSILVHVAVYIEPFELTLTLQHIMAWLDVKTLVKGE